MKGWNEYFNNKLNEEDDWDEDEEEEVEEASQGEKYAIELGLLNCEIMGATIMDNGIKLNIRNDRLITGFCEITVKNGKIDIYTKF